MRIGKTQSSIRLIKMAIDAALEKSTQRLRLAKVMYNEKDYELFKKIYYGTMEIKEDERIVYLYGAVGVKKLLDDWKEVYDIILDNAEEDAEENLGLTHVIRFGSYIEKERIIKGKTSVQLDLTPPDPEDKTDLNHYKEGMYFSSAVIRGGKNIYSLIEWIDYTTEDPVGREQAKKYVEKTLEGTGLLEKKIYNQSIATQLALYILGG